MIRYNMRSKPAPAMLPLCVDGCHQAQHGVDDQDEQVHRQFEEAVETEWNAGSWNGHIPQVFNHILLKTCTGTSIISQRNKTHQHRAVEKWTGTGLQVWRYIDPPNKLDTVLEHKPLGSFCCGSAASTTGRRSEPGSSTEPEPVSKIGRRTA